MVELVDSVDLGSSVLDVQVRVLLPAPIKKRRLSLLFFIGIDHRRTRTHLNATVRWTVAEIRLDGFHSIRFRKAETAIESCHPHKKARSQPAGNQLTVGCFCGILKPPHSRGNF